AHLNPVFYFHPDGYLLTGPKLMGRHAAGAGLLRAAIEAAGEEPLTVAILANDAADAFRDHVAAAAPQARYTLISARRQELLAQTGLSSRPDLQLIGPARGRLRQGPAAYAICGLPHTLATDRVLDHFARLPFEPFMPWDAVICTSRAALS